MRLASAGTMAKARSMRKPLYSMMSAISRWASWIRVWPRALASVLQVPYMPLGLSAPHRAEDAGVGTRAGPELAEDASFVVGLHAELGGELDTLVQMRFADVAARAWREGRDRPELAAVATVSTTVAVGGGIRFRGLV
jgi:hypothetical protein